MRVRLGSRDTSDTGNTYGALSAWSSPLSAGGAKNAGWHQCCALHRYGVRSRLGPPALGSIEARPKLTGIHFEGH